MSNSENFPNHGFYISPNDDPLSGHLFNMEDGKWRTLRSKLPSSFTSAKMRKMFSIMVGMINPYTNILDSYADNFTPLDIKSVVSRFTTDIISACAFGFKSDTLDFKNEKLMEHGRNFFDYQWSSYKNNFVMAFPRRLLQKLKFRIFPKETENYFMDLFGSILEYRRNSGSIRGDLTDSLIKLTEKRDEEKDFSGKNVMDPLEKSEFVAQMFLFFAAGFETSSSTQTFAIFELAKNPECQMRLREEINRVLKKYDEVLSYDAMMDMKYLDNVVDETLRIYPVFSNCCKNVQRRLPNSSNLGIQRDPEYYPNPMQFNPDRFNTENKSSRPHIANLPFGEGPRICVGKRFGLLQAKLGLATIIKNYEVTLNEKTCDDFQFVSNELILRKKGDVWINLKKIHS
ncbi:hypothetical protein JTB14_029949 [Gonioctena quinquepunctata]|nr:hypothetical protein JTB14_029949 [Gonioctena quinquepunctata]